MFSKTAVQKGVFVSILMSFLAVELPAGDGSPDAMRKIGPALQKAIYRGGEKKSAATFSVDGEVGHSDESDEPVKAIVVMDADHLKPLSPAAVEKLKEKVEALGGHIGNHAFNNVQVWVPLEAVPELASWESVKTIKAPFKPAPMSVVSEGVSLVGADSRHAAGMTGQGVKAGVIDAGFYGYERLLGTELPASVKTRAMGGEAEFLSSVHGTACAEILHDVAPGVDMHLANAGDIEVDFPNAISWFKDQGVSIVSSSIGLNLTVRLIFLDEILNAPYSFQMDYYMDQMAQFDRIVEQYDRTVSSAVADGMTWFQAAGNDGRKKWEGTFVDTDGDGYLNFSPRENYNEIDVSGANFGDEMYIAIMWGDDTDNRTTDDYDLYIRNRSGRVLCASAIDQKRYPVGTESCRVDVSPFETYRVHVENYDASAQRIGILLGYEKFPEFKHSTAEGTVELATPAQNPDVVTVGAVAFDDVRSIEPYSSQGPNDQGVAKPDLVAPDAVSTESYGAVNFAGTSAAAPHAAGAGALVKQMHPSWTPAQIKQYLEENATDLGEPGKDNVFGSGLANLPELAPDEKPDVFENFDSGAGGFAEDSYFGASAGELRFWGYCHDKYRVNPWIGQNPPGSAAPVAGDVNYFTDFRAKVDARWRGGSEAAGFGLTVNANCSSSQPCDGVTFLVDNTGRYSIRWIRGDDSVAIVDETFSPAVGTRGAFNALTVEKTGKKFVFGINGSTVETLAVEGVGGGAVGVAASCAVAAAFDDFSIERIDDTEDPGLPAGNQDGTRSRGHGLFYRY